MKGVLATVRRLTRPATAAQGERLDIGAEARAKIAREVLACIGPTWFNLEGEAR
jgi:hypothetical protein